MDTLNAPNIGGCAVWTGNEMLVWGGSANSGAKYDPQTNTWTTISASGEPTPEVVTLVFGQEPICSFGEV
ncbi:MAG: hypothetical protein U0T36_06965 [Saprospiraceae bacterium]